MPEYDMKVYPYPDGTMWNWKVRDRVVPNEGPRNGGSGFANSEEEARTAVANWVARERRCCRICNGSSYSVGAGRCLISKQEIKFDSQWVR